MKILRRLVKALFGIAALLYMGTAAAVGIIIGKGLEPIDFFTSTGLTNVLLLVIVSLLLLNEYDRTRQDNPAEGK